MSQVRIFFLVLFALTNASQAAPSEFCTAKSQHTPLADSGRKVMILAAVGISLYKQDWLGAALSQVLAHGLYHVSWKLKFDDKIAKKRPCGCKGAFPSGHMIIYASNASYLHYRYGWQYGLPAYVASFAFASDRVRNKAHSWGDMLGTFAIVNLIAYFVTPRFTYDVAYLPSFYDEEKQKKKKEPAVEFLPAALATEKSYFLGFKLRF